MYKINKKILPADFPSLQAILSKRGSSFHLEVSSKLNPSILDILPYQEKKNNYKAENLQQIDNDALPFFQKAIYLADCLEQLHQQGFLATELAPHTLALGEQKAYYLLPPWQMSSKPAPKRSNFNSLLWAAPEQTGHTDSVIDHRSDMYSLGCIYFWLLTRNTPFSGKTTAELISAHLSRTIELKAWEPLTRVIHKLLQKDPARRYQSAAVLARDLRYLAARNNQQIGKAWYPGRLDPGPNLRSPDIPVGFDATLKRCQQFLQKNEDRGFLFIAGNPGAGKSFLVNKILEVKKAQTSILEMKFELTQSMDLFYILKNSIGRLIQQLEPKIVAALIDELKGWKEPESFFLSYFLPESLLPKRLERLFDLPADKRIAISIFSFVEFLSVLTKKIKLLIFVDDLQWADSLFIKYLNNILNNDEIDIQLIGTYRQHEVDPASLFSETIKDLELMSNCHLETLQPLKKLGVRKIVRRMLGKYDNVSSLSERIYEYSQGNPFHTVQVILHLQEQGILNYSNKTWQEDKDKFNSFKIDIRMQNLLLQRLQRCSESAQAILVIASMMPEQFSISNLSNYAEIEPSEAEKAISELSNAALLTTRDSLLSFSHDKLREAASELVPLEQRAILARKIFMLQAKQINNSAELIQVVQIASRYYKSWPKPMRTQLGTLAERCLQIAYNAALIKEAVMYADLALDCSIQDKNKLNLQKAESLYLLGMHEDVLKTLELVDDAYKTEKDDLILRSLAAASLYQEAVDHGLQMLRDLGKDLPTDFKGSLIIKQGRKLKELFSIDQVVALSEQQHLTDDELIKVIKTIHIISPLAFFLNMAMSTWLQMELLILHLQNGNSKYLGFSVINYAAILCTMGDYQNGFTIGQRAMQIVDARYQSLSPAVAHVYLNWVHHWGSPHQNLKERFIDKIQLAKKTGDAISVGYLVSFFGWHISMIHQTAAEFRYVVKKYRKVLQQINYQDGLIIFDCFQAYLDAIDKDQDYQLPLTDQLAQRLPSSQMKMQYVVYYTMSTRYCLIQGNFERAQYFHDQASPFVSFMSSGIIMYEHLLFKILCKAGTIQEAIENEDKRLLLKWMKRLKTMTETCSENFQMRYRLADLAIQASQGDFNFNDWIEYLNEFHQAEGGLNLIGAQLALLFSKNSDNHVLIAGLQSYLKSSAERYKGQSHPVAEAGYNQIRDAGQKLLLAASDSDLAENFLRVLMEQTGSTKAFFHQLEETNIVHTMEVNAGKLIYEKKEKSGLPSQLTDFMEKSSKDGLQVSTKGEWQSFFDKYLPTGSAIATSISLGSQQLALIYFENSLLADFFTTERLGLIELLSGLAAIGMQNQKLLDEQQRINQSLEDKVELKTAQHKMAQEQAESALVDLKKSKTELEETKTKASMNMLAAHMAHEVNNPLNYISTGLTITEDAHNKFEQSVYQVIPNDAEGGEFKASLELESKKVNLGLHQVEEGLSRISNVIKEIRAITGIDGYHITNFNLFDVIYDEVEYTLKRSHQDESNFELKVNDSIYPEKTQSPLKILSSPAVIARALRSVIAHGIYFSLKQNIDQTPKVHLEIINKGETISIIVANNGRSIKTAELADVFDINKTKSHGTELIGLPIIKVLLHQIEAEIEIQDTGRSSGWVRFHINLPAERKD